MVGRTGDASPVSPAVATPLPFLSFLFPFPLRPSPKARGPEVLARKNILKF